MRSERGNHYSCNLYIQVPKFILYDYLAKHNRNFLTSSNWERDSSLTFVELWVNHLFGSHGKVGGVNTCLLYSEVMTVILGK